MKMTRKTKADWLARLKGVVRARPIVILRFDADAWATLQESRGGTNHFTIARRHPVRNAVRVPTICFLAGENSRGQSELHIGLLKSRSPITTLESRLSITAAHPITPSSERALLRLVTDKALKPILDKRLRLADSVVTLSPLVSIYLIERLGQISGNRRALLAVEAATQEPQRFANNRAMQKDAIALALKVFGLSPADHASVVEERVDSESGLADVPVREDAVIEHDARVIPGFHLDSSDLTGRAVFRNGNEALEVITANKRPLEEMLGVDLIYLNALKGNVVMVQYKMLERVSAGGDTDWLYRPDKQFEKELARMKRFCEAHPPALHEYRINPQVFYLRFVRRDAILGQAAITIPIDQFQVLRSDPRCSGPKGAFRISFNTLGGRYLRQDGFLDLLSSGYIGAYASRTRDFTRLIESSLRSNRAIVAAWQGSWPAR